MANEDQMQDSKAVKIAISHVHAWSCHDWNKTKELLPLNVHAFVTSTQPAFGSGEFTRADNYMERKKQAAQLVEPGSVRLISTIGDKSNALILMTFRIGLGPGGTMVTMARSSRYLLDQNGKIKDERDQFVVLSQ